MPRKRNHSENKAQETNKMAFCTLITLSDLQDILNNHDDKADDDLTTFFERYYHRECNMTNLFHIMIPDIQVPDEYKKLQHILLGDPHYLDIRGSVITFMETVYDRIFNPRYQKKKPQERLEFIRKHNSLWALKSFFWKIRITAEEPLTLYDITNTKDVEKIYDLYQECLADWTDGIQNSVHYLPNQMKRDFPVGMTQPEKDAINQFLKDYNKWYNNTITVFKVHTIRIIEEDTFIEADSQDEAWLKIQDELKQNNNSSYSLKELIRSDQANEYINQHTPEPLYHQTDLGYTAQISYPEDPENPTDYETYFHISE